MSVPFRVLQNQLAHVLRDSLLEERENDEPRKQTNIVRVKTMIRTFAYAALSATRTLLTPATLETSSATLPQSDPATSTCTSPPIADAADTVDSVL